MPRGLDANLGDHADELLARAQAEVLAAFGHDEALGQVALV